MKAACCRGVASQMPEQRLIRVELPEEAPAPSAYAEADRRQAIADLLHHNRFDPEGLPRGPYVLGLAVREGRLVFDICNEGGATLHVLALARVQAIDMGRRGLHNEGAELLRARLAGRVALDFDTARQLFTLVCALHQRI